MKQLKLSYKSELTMANRLERFGRIREKRATGTTSNRDRLTLHLLRGATGIKGARDLPPYRATARTSVPSHERQQRRNGLSFLSLCFSFEITSIFCQRAHLQKA